ncbi:MAG: hypothetical protein ACXV8J_06925 [Methylobacter sp.]
MAEKTEYDVSYFPFSSNKPNESDIQAKLTVQASDGWRMSWILAAGDGVLMVLERPVPPPPSPPNPSLGGYAT